MSSELHAAALVIIIQAIIQQFPLIKFIRRNDQILRALNSKRTWNPNVHKKIHKQQLKCSPASGKQNQGTGGDQHPWNQQGTLLVSESFPPIYWTQRELQELQDRRQQSPQERNRQQTQQAETSQNFSFALQFPKIQSVERCFTRKRTENNRTIGHYLGTKQRIGCPVVSFLKSRCKRAQSERNGKKPLKGYRHLSQKGTARGRPLVDRCEMLRRKNLSSSACNWDSCQFTEKTWEGMELRWNNWD